jgi:hypothetical protein
VGRRTFKHRIETFGFNTDSPWALDAFRLLFHVPRAYQPLVEAWEHRHPGTRRALDRLAAMEFVAYQPAVVIDTRTAENADRPGRVVRRYRTSAKGRRLVQAMNEDLRVLEDQFPRLTPANVSGLARLLQAFDLEDSHAKFGMSMGHAGLDCGLPDRTVRWWVSHLAAEGFLRELGERYADVREVIPAHWRVTRTLRNQLSDVLGVYDPEIADAYAVEFRLNRSRFLGDIDPARLGISGATDYDHDVECQRALGALLRSLRCAVDGIFTIEPRITLPMDQTGVPWRFDVAGTEPLFYQPDAEIRERDPRTGAAIRSIIEYERYQGRRDAWSHIERFLGYLHTHTLPFEGAVLRFVVDSDSRIRAYVALIEAFADYAMDHTEIMPPNPVTLAVSSVPRVLSAADPLDPRGWHRIKLPSRTAGSGADTDPRPVLHPKKASPYDDYFARVTVQAQ